MIKYLRRIRKSLLGSGTAKKYLLYAVGEVFLVMVGILLALQVNNWNEHRKDRIEEQSILRQLKEEYERNLKQLESKILIRKLLIQSSQKMLSYIDNPDNAPKDSIFAAMSRGGYRPTFDPISNDIISSNKLSLIRDERLRELLSQWETNVYQLKEEELFWKNYNIESRLPFLAEKKLTRKLYFTSSMINKKPYLLEDFDNNPILFSDTKKDIDFQDLLVDPRLEALLVTSIFSSTDANLISETLKKYMLEILELLESNLHD